MNTGEIPFRETRMLHVVLFIVFAVAVIAVTLLVLIYLVIDPLMSQMGTLNTGSFNQLSFRRIDLTGADRNAGCVPRPFPERGHFSLPKTGISGRFMFRFFKEEHVSPSGVP